MGGNHEEAQMDFSEFVKQLKAEVEKQNRHWAEVRVNLENRASSTTSSDAPAESPRALPNGLALRG
jgi:hypothetical protein